MMFLPDRFDLKETAHGHGKGMWFYDFQDTADLGVHVHQRKDQKGQRTTWKHAALPEQQYESLEALRVALAPLTRQQWDAELAKWPQVQVQPEAPGLNNRCRLCPREPHVRATHRVTVMLSWCERGHYAGLCDEHIGMAALPAALIAALDAEVAKRRSAAKALEAKHP